MTVFTDQFKKQLKQSVGTQFFHDNLLQGISLLNADLERQQEAKLKHIGGILIQCTPEQLAAAVRLNDKMNWNFEAFENGQVIIRRDGVYGYVNADGTYGKA